MKNKQKLIVLVTLILVVGLAVAVFAFNQPNDRCTRKDRVQNNCVLTGRCTPLGDPREATIDCQLKNYDHKFDLNK